MCTDKTPNGSNILFCSHSVGISFVKLLQAKCLFNYNVLDIYLCESSISIILMNNGRLFSNE